MKSMLVGVFLVAAVACVTHQLGILERPPFVHSDVFLGCKEILAVVATTRERNIGRHVGRLVEGSMKGVEFLEKGKLKAAAKAYGLDDTVPSISFGLYFDDPSEAEHPRWAIGWAVDGLSFEELQAMLPDIQKSSGLSETIKAVRIGGVGTETLTARIPWRNHLTPMIAPMLHWRRGFHTYQDYLEKIGLSSTETEIPPIALEVYVCGENDTKKFIDYTVLFGNIEKTWADCFPESLAGKESTVVPGEDATDVASE